MKKIIMLLTVVGVHAYAEQVCPPNLISRTPDARFVVNDDTVKDTITGLIWQRCSLGLSGENCTNGVLEKHKGHRLLQHVASVAPDWRVPNAKELASLVEPQCYDPAINATIFPNTASMGYWTSTYKQNKRGGYALVDFSDGRVFAEPTRNSRAVRLVKNQTGDRIIEIISRSPETAPNSVAPKKTSQD